MISRFGCIRISSSNDHGKGSLTPPIGVNADYRDLADAGVPGENTLHLGRIDVLTAGDDHVLEAVVEVEIAVLVERSAVSGAKPVTVQHGGRSGCFATPVTLHDVSAADDDLAAGTDRDDSSSVTGSTMRMNTPNIGCPTDFNRCAVDSSVAR